MSEVATFIASIVDIAGFGLTAIAGIVGLGCSGLAINRSFFVTFYCLIILISLLQISIGALNLANPPGLPTLRQLLYVEQMINNFSLVGQIAIILTIAYGWSIISAKLREQYQQSAQKFDKKRSSYMILVVTLLVLLAIATTGISVYVAIVGNTLPLSVDGIELVVYLVTLVCCFIQFHEGRQLSRLLNEYKRVIGIKISKIRFNLVYIVAFLLVLVRSGVEIGRLLFVFINGSTVTSFWSSATYFILYTLFEVIPLSLYLIGIQVERSKEEIGQRALRESIISESSNRSSVQKRETELT